MKTNCEISHAELVRLLAYNPETGVFTWKVRRCGVTLGQVAGSVDKGHRYARIKVSETLYLAHRLAWFYTHGVWPKNELDHIDRDRGNNRLANLREATRSQNACNKPTYRNNRTGVRGVCWHKQHRKYIASIQLDGRSRHIGLFRDLNQAAEAYRQASLKIHGCFSSLQSA